MATAIGCHRAVYPAESPQETARSASTVGRTGLAREQNLGPRHGPQQGDGRFG
jgi:hypothetical protein